MEPRFPASRSTYDTVLQFFQEDDWRFQQLEGQPVFRLGFRGDNGSFDCFAKVVDERPRFLFYSVMESNVPPEKRPAAAEFITRANYGLALGNFEMDFSDGEVRYKTSVDVDGGQLTVEMVKTMVYTNLLMMDRYFPGLKACIWGDVTPEEAIAQIENA